MDQASLRRPHAVRTAVVAAGGTPVRGRRLQDESLPSAMTLREELETAVGDGTSTLRLRGALGFRVWFRYQKYREEFALEDVIIAIDGTPVGTYVEIESLFVRHCQEHGLPITDRVFSGQ